MDGKHRNVSNERLKGGDGFLVVAIFSKTGTSRSKSLCSFSSSPYKYINQSVLINYCVDGDKGLFMNDVLT